MARREVEWARRALEREWVWVLGAMSAAAVAAAFVLRLWRANLRIPFEYSGDSLFHESIVKAIVDHGWYLNNHNLGAPFGQANYDFPEVTGDHLHVLVLRAFSFFTSDAALVENVFYLLGFPVIAGVSYLVMRRLIGARAPSLVCSVLFALLPYHFERFQHLFLADYTSVAIGALLALRVLAGEPLLVRRTGVRGPRAWLSRRSLGTVALCVVIGGTGTYFATFAIILALAAGIVAALSRQSWRPAAIAGVIAVAIVATLAANYLPTAIYKLRHGPDPAALVRSPFESELYALKATLLLFPIPTHRIAAFANLTRDYYQSTVPPPNENTSATLGSVGDIGFATLILTLLVVLAWPARVIATRMRHAALLTAVAFGIGTAGGGSAVVAYLGSPPIRGWNRISVSIAFFCLLAVAMLLARLRARLRPSVYVAVLGVVLVLGTLDQTSPANIPHYAQVAGSYRSDGDLVHRIERFLPRGASVFQLPIASYPEEGSAVGGQVSGDNLRPYLHSNRLRWSYGAMRGRPADWQAQLDHNNTPSVLRAAALAGFDGVLVDHIGFTDPAGQVPNILASAPMQSSDGRYSFYDLRPYSARLLATLSPSQRTAAREAVLHPERLSTGPGVYASDGNYSWVQQNGEIDLVTPLAHTVTLSGALASPTAAHVTLRYPDGSTETLLTSATGRPFTHTALLRAGSSRLLLTSDAPSIGAHPGDPRDLHFRLIGLHAS